LNKFCDKSDSVNSKIAIGVGLDQETLKDLYKNIKNLNDILKDENAPVLKVEPTQSSTKEEPTQSSTKEETTQYSTKDEPTHSSTKEEPAQSTTKDDPTQNKKAKDKRIKKPYYQDGDNVVVDLNSIAGVFGENANGGNIGDMMKMFGPMMEGLMGNLNQHKQTNDKTSSDKTTNDKTSSDKTSSDKTSSDKTSSDKTSSDKTSSDIL
jgi:DNA replication initiation complex subunit (GINS family)